MDSLREFDIEAEMIVREKDVRRRRTLEARLEELEARVEALEHKRIADAQATVERAFAPIEVRQGPRGIPRWSSEDE